MHLILGFIQKWDAPYSIASFKGRGINCFKQVAAEQTSLEKRTFAVKPYIEEVLVSLQPHVKKNYTYLDC